MNKVVMDFTDDACRAVLVHAAEAIIKENAHRLLATPSPPDERSLSRVSGVVTYKDRQSHVVFAASRTTTGCQVHVTESFTFKSPCITVREEVFKRWQQKGKLNSHTWVLSHQRRQEEKAYLTDARDASSCLVSRHKTF